MENERKEKLLQRKAAKLVVHAGKVEERAKRRATIYIVIGPKGGIGKSTLARLLIDKYRLAGGPVRIVQIDRTALLPKLYGELVSVVHLPGVEDMRGDPLAAMISMEPLSAAIDSSLRPHSLPIPPRVVLLLERARAPKESAFVFPSTRGLKEKDRPLSRWSIATAIDRLRGRSANPKAGAEFDGPDLLEGIPVFAPHDLRRTFATTCSDLSVRGDAISAVLDHADPASTGLPPIRTADITRVAYDYSQRLDLKRQAIEAWTNALFAACDDEWKAHQPRRGMLRIAPKHEPWYSTMERQKAEAKPQIDLAKLRSLEEADW